MFRSRSTCPEQTHAEPSPLFDAVGSSAAQPRAASVIRVLDVSAEAYCLSGLHPGGADTPSALIDILRQAAEQVTAARRAL
jgi:hypothetical protein